jgi:hypothetical protein
VKTASRLACVGAALALAGCVAQTPHEDLERMTRLKATYARLHERLEKAAASEPLVASAFADRGQVVLAIRSGLIEELAGNVARRYLDLVTVDLSGVQAHKTQELRKRTFLGSVRLGEWSVSVELGDLVGELRAGSPRVGLRRPNLIDVEVPVDVQETEGVAKLRFGWDASALTNAFCRDFELTRELRGHVLAQRHVLTGALRLENTGESLIATPVFPDRRVLIKLDLTPRSWAVVEAALRSQDTLGKCGMMIDPDKGLVRLKALAAQGIIVRLPASIFRPVSLPAHLQTSVKVNQRTIGLRLTAESLRIETATLWSSVSVQVQSETRR